MPELLKMYPKAHLQIVGNGEDFSRLQNIIKEKNLGKNIEMTGRIDDEELRLRYASCDMYVSASTNEHCPVPTFEAMACGRPLVLSELESHMEIINVSKAGLTFSFSNNHDLCQKIINVYENKEVFGKDALKFVQNHSLQEFSKRVEEIYNKILNQ
jgi:glycosyltransferase involved in cell wall biosynthesis